MDGRCYELLFAVRPDAGEDTVKGVIQRVKELVEGSKGQVIKTEDWGKRKVAYPLHKYPEGHYVLVNLTGPPALPKEIERVLKTNEDVLRCQTVKVTAKGSKGQAPSVQG